MSALRDDLGSVVALPRPPRRIVSLVPSLTEALAGNGCLVGATQWCTHPGDLGVARIRGTKNPDLGAISRLRPDLVVANQEENRALDVARLRAQGIAVWVTVIESLEDAFTSIGRLFTDALRRPEPAWLAEARSAWATPAPDRAERAVIPVWRDPWMVVGSRTFMGDLLARLGVGNAFADDAARYRGVSLAQIRDHEPDLIVLPDEPYAFSSTDGPADFPGVPVALVDGRLLTWYGPSLVTARSTLVAQLGRVLG